MPPPAVTYVRHAMPLVVEGVHPVEWHLDDEGRRAAGAVAQGLEVREGLGALVSSTEPKALETAAEIGARWSATVEGDDRLREADRPWIGPGYRAMAHRYLRGEPLVGWEPHAQVAARMGAGVDAAVEGAQGRSVVIVTHGLALSVHLGDRLGPEFDQESFWSRLAFPDAWVLDPSGVLHRSPPSLSIS